MKLELEQSKQTSNKYKTQLEFLQSIILSLEKEIGWCSSSDQLYSEHFEDELVSKLKENFDSYILKIKTNEEKIASLEKKIKSETNSATELKKKLFIESRECHNLKKQVENVQSNLEHTKELFSLMKNDLTNAENICTTLKESKNQLNEQLLEKQLKLESATIEIQVLERKLNETLSKECLLQDNIKNLQDLLNQKNGDIDTLHDQYKKSTDHWVEKEIFLENSISLLKTDIKELQMELNSVFKDKFVLQKQCTELRVALQGLIDQNKVLKTRITTLSKNTTSDILSNLPSPTKYDDSYVLNLLQQSNISLNSTPLSNLQNCLDSLKEEMANLQKQVTAKTQLGAN